MRHLCGDQSGVTSQMEQDHETNENYQKQFDNFSPRFFRVGWP